MFSYNLREDLEKNLTWQNSSLQAIVAPQIDSNTIISRVHLSLDILDSKYVDQAMNVEFKFDITGEKSQDNLFKLKGKLQLSPLETKVVVRRTGSFKLLQTYDECIIAATLQV